MSAETAEPRPDPPGPTVVIDLWMTLGGSRGEPHQTNPRKTSERARAAREAPEKGRAAGQREGPAVAESQAWGRRRPGHRRHCARPAALALGRGRGRNVVRTFRSATYLRPPLLLQISRPTHPAPI